ncbi:hypothetical protein T484DRAFT_1793311, partial [Baffinella frigidus]
EGGVEVDEEWEEGDGEEEEEIVRHRRPPLVNLQPLNPFEGEGEIFGGIRCAPDVIAGLTASGISEPLPIQATAMPGIAEGLNSIIHSPTTLTYLPPLIARPEADPSAKQALGSGKTLTYLLPLIARLEADPSAKQALVLVPTRELALQ